MISDELLDADYRSGPGLYSNNVPASRGKRFANYLLDQIAIILMGGLTGILLGTLFPSVIDSWLFDDTNRFSDYIFGAVLAMIYYPLTEGLLAGKSLGKFITKTRAVQKDGTPVTMEDVIKRSASRIVPFEALSFLGQEPVRGWHDKWTDTMVVDEKVRYSEA